VIGAAIQGSLFRDSTNKIKVSLPYPKVVPLSIGLAQSDGLFKILIPQNTPLPFQVSQLLSLSSLSSSSSSSSKQFSTIIRLYQGQRIFANDNILLAEIPITFDKEIKDSKDIQVSLSLEINAENKLKCIIMDLSKTQTTKNKKLEPMIIDVVVPSEQENKKTLEEKKIRSNNK